MLSTHEGPSIEGSSTSPRTVESCACAGVVDPCLVVGGGVVVECAAASAAIEARSALRDVRMSRAVLA
jgi:hypothetical protein